MADRIVPARSYGRILVPLDGSKNAEEVLPYAEFLSKGL
jgi:hypothetical protein